jgi:glycopeptide antibiotics resistance protein
VGFLLVLALGGVLTLTLLPDLRGAFWENRRYAVQQCTLTGAGPHPLSELLTATQSSLNVALFVPVGLAVTLARSRTRAGATALGATALPFAVEYAQYLVPSLGRACDAQDIWDNLFGLAIGLLGGLLLGPPLRAAVRGLRSRRPARGHN